MATLGLDIGSKSIKAVELVEQGDKFLLRAAGVTATPQNGLSGSEQDSQATAQAIKKLISDTRITAREANLSLPESQVFTRLIEFPSLTDEEVASAISWQAESYIPIPQDEANVDYQIVGRRQEKGAIGGAVEVLLVAAPKKIVDKYVKICSFADLTIASVETELIALSRSLAPPNTTALIADFGGSSTNLAVVRSGQLMLSRSISTGGDALTRAVTKGLSVTPQQAEEYKKAYGLSKKQLEGKVGTALALPFRIIVDEMKKAVQYYKQELKKDEPVAEVILAGAAAGMPEITPFLAEQLGLEVTVGDPLTKIIKDERINAAFGNYAPLYGVVIGLAQKQ